MSRSPISARATTASSPCAASRFAVPPGEVLGLVGPNGAGKTTTLRCLAGHPAARAPAASQIAGIDLAADPVGAKRALAFVPDEPHLFEYLTVEEHLRFVARLYGVADAEPRARAAARGARADAEARARSPTSCRAA